MIDFNEDFNIEIIDKNKIRKRTVCIKRVPYKVFQIHQKVEREANRVRAFAEERNENLSEIARLKKEKPEGFRVHIKEIKKDNEAIEQSCFDIEDSGFFDIRFEAIKLILASNGITEDDELMDQEVWLTKIDYVTPMSLLKTATEKDLKKIMAAAKR